MTKEQLLGRICLADAINECCSEDVNSDTSCEKCELELSILLDKFAKQIRADAIGDCQKAIGRMFCKYVNNECLLKIYVEDTLEELKSQDSMK